MPINPAPPPFHNPMTDRRTGLITKEWSTYLRDRDAAIQRTTPLRATVSRDTLAASIGLTPFRAFQTGPLAAGLYRVTWTARITTPATISSSVQVHLTYTRGGATCILNGTALTGNTTSSVTTASALIRIDQSSAVSYSTTYATSGATAMVYEIDLTLEQVDPS